MIAEKPVSLIGMVRYPIMTNFLTNSQDAEHATPEIGLLTDDIGVEGVKIYHYVGEQLRKDGEHGT